MRLSNINLCQNYTFRYIKIAITSEIRTIKIEEISSHKAILKNLNFVDAISELIVI